MTGSVTVIANTLPEDVKLLQRPFQEDSAFAHFVVNATDADDVASMRKALSTRKFCVPVHELRSSSRGEPFRVIVGSNASELSMPEVALFPNHAHQTYAGAASLRKTTMLSLRRIRTAWIVGTIPCAAALSASCGMVPGDGMGNMHGRLPAAEVIAPAPWPGSLSVPTVADDNPDPNVVEVSLRAAPTEVEYVPGRRTQAWAYNGSVPGPTIRAKVGDEIIVHFSNRLPEPTTIHWHGVRVPSSMDGTVMMQQPVQPGSTFDYRFKALDAGTFWYHPHIRSDVQVDKGLYGTIVIDEPNEPAIPAVADEIVVLDDVLVDGPSGSPMSTGMGGMMGMGMGGGMRMGQEGNFILVDGARANVELAVRAGEVRRWRFVNTANARFFRLALSGGTMIRIGSDAGLLARPHAVSEILLVNGQREDVLVSVNQSGTTAVLQALPYARAMGMTSSGPIHLIRLVANTEPAATPPALPDPLRNVTAPAQPVKARSLRLGERMSHGGWVFTINGAAYPNVPVIDSSVGDAETWQIVNETEMDHPFHLHGFFFWVPSGKEWRDTVNIPANATVALQPYFDPRPGAGGSWAYHCHILEHAEAGMMGEVRVR